MDDVIAELDKIFGKATLSKSLMLKRFGNSYEPKYGFRVSVNRLHGLAASPSKNIVHYVVSQFVPPGRLLRSDPQMGPDVHVFKDQDWQTSPWNSI